MNCKNCGNILESNATFCSKCGSKVKIETLNQVVNPIPNSIETQPNQTVNPNENNNLMTNGQQPMNNSYNYQMPNNNINIQPNQTNPNNKNNNTLFTVLIVICVAIIIGLGAFIGIKLLSDKDTTPNNNETQNNVSTNDKTTEKVENVGTNDIANNKITIYDYTFALPEYLQYNNGTNYIYAANSDISMVFNFYPQNVSYESVKADFSVVEQNLRESGAIVEKAIEATYEGRNYIIATLNMDGYYMFYYITKLDTNYIVEGTIQGTTEEHFNSALKAINEIMGSVEKTNSFASTESKEYKDAVGYKGKLDFKK